MTAPVPKVSVIMAVYNERPYLEKAVQSVLDQTFGDFEFIIVNDGSTDGSKEVLERFEQNSARIRLIHQENRGLIASVNRGLELAKGQYIARMDGDDICYPERFERQVRFLDSSPEVGILGTQIEKIDADGEVREDWKWSLPTDPEVISWRLLFNTCLCNPSVMMRRSILESLGGYARWATYVEDYELFTRAVLQTRLANLPDTLLKFRRHEGSVTVKRREEQIRTSAKAAIALHQAILGSSVSEQNVRFLVWMDIKDLEQAIQETRAEDFVSIHKYLRSLYKAYIRRFTITESNVLVLRRALRKLDTIAGQIYNHKELGGSLLYRCRSLSIVSGREVFPLVWQLLKSRISQ